jgi:hypothetical protein
MDGDMEYYDSYEETEYSDWSESEYVSDDYSAEESTAEGDTSAVDTSDNTEVIERLDTLIETLSLSGTYGSIGDYYNQTLGFTVFPDLDTYAYFIDIDADGSQWACASDGHYVPVFALEVYEDSISTEEEEEEEIAEPSEHEIQSLETLESVNGVLSVIKENDTAYYESSLAYAEEITQSLEEINARLEVTGYILLAVGFFVALGCGNRFCNSFFERMRG